MFEQDRVRLTQFRKQQGNGLKINNERSVGSVSFVGYETRARDDANSGLHLDWRVRPGLFFGKVMARDPVMPFRLRIWIPEFTTMDAEETFDPSTDYRFITCLPLLPMGGSTGSGQWTGYPNSYGMVGIPEPGSWVGVMFPDMNIGMGVWFGGLPNLTHAGYTNPGRPHDGAAGSDCPLPSSEEPLLRPGSASSDNDLAKNIVLSGNVHDPVRGPWQSGANGTKSTVVGFKSPGAPDEGQLGHTIFADDDPAYQGIALRTSKGMQINMSDSAGAMYLAGNQSKAWVELSDQGHVMIHAAKSLSIHAEESLRLQVDKDFVLEVGGDMLAAIGGDHKAVVGGDQYERVMGNTTKKHDGYMEAAIVKDETRSVGGNYRREVTGDITHKTDKKHVTLAKDDIKRNSSDGTLRDQSATDDNASSGDKAGLNIKDGIGGPQDHYPVKRGTVLLMQQLKQINGDVAQINGFNDFFHHGLEDDGVTPNGKSFSDQNRHKRGLAGDLDVPGGPAARARVMRDIQKLGQDAGVNIRVRDEYTDPSEQASGGHVHFEFDSEEDAKTFEDYYDSSSATRRAFARAAEAAPKENKALSDENLPKKMLPGPPTQDQQKKGRPGAKKEYLANKEKTTMVPQREPWRPEFQKAATAPTSTTADGVPNKEVVNNNDGETRAVRNNNPGNIERSGANFAGEMPESLKSAGQQAESLHRVFRNPDYGYAALTTLLEGSGYRGNPQTQTVRSVIRRYVGNGVSEDYIDSVARECGVDPDDQMQWDDRDFMHRFMRGITKNESPGWRQGFFDDGQIERGMGIAGWKQGGPYTPSSGEKPTPIPPGVPGRERTTTAENSARSPQIGEDCDFSPPYVQKTAFSSGASSGGSPTTDDEGISKNPGQAVTSGNSAGFGGSRTIAGDGGSQGFDGVRPGGGQIIQASNGISSGREQKNVDYLIVHSTGTTESNDIGVQELHAWHGAKGWSGPYGPCGFHQVIRRDGTIEIGRPDEVVGMHSPGFNIGSLAVALVGGKRSTLDGTWPNYTDAQLESLRKVITVWAKIWPKAVLLGAYQVAATKASPSFDLSKWWKMSKVVPVLRGQGPIPGYKGEVVLDPPTLRNFKI